MRNIYMKIDFIDFFKSVLIKKKSLENIKLIG